MIAVMILWTRHPGNNTHRTAPTPSAKTTTTTTEWCGVYDKHRVSDKSVPHLHDIGPRVIVNVKVVMIFFYHVRSLWNLTRGVLSRHHFYCCSSSSSSLTLPGFLDPPTYVCFSSSFCPARNPSRAQKNLLIPPKF